MNPSSFPTGEAQNFAVDLQRSLPGEVPEDTDEGNLVGDTESVEGPSPLCHLVAVGFEGAAVADQTGEVNVGVAGRHDVSGQNGRLDKSIPEAKHDKFLMPHV